MQSWLIGTTACFLLLRLPLVHRGIHVAFWHSNLAHSLDLSLESVPERHTSVFSFPLPLIVVVAFLRLCIVGVKIDYRLFIGFV
jgi:hypothetical protein